MAEQGKTTGRKGVSELSKFFGRKPGQTLKEFAEEVKELPDTDFYELVDGIKDGTHTY